MCVFCFAKESTNCCKREYVANDSLQCKTCHKKYHKSCISEWYCLLSNVKWKTIVSRWKCIVCKIKGNTTITTNQKINVSHDFINENNSIIHQKTYENLQRTQQKVSIREMFEVIQALIFNKHNSQKSTCWKQQFFSDDNFYFCCIRHLNIKSNTIVTRTNTKWTFAVIYSHDWT